MTESAVQSDGLPAAAAAQLLGIGQSLFYELHKSGRLGPLPFRLGRAVRWSRRELLAWIDAGTPVRQRWLVMHPTGARRAG